MKQNSLIIMVMAVIVAVFLIARKQQKDAVKQSKHPTGGLLCPDMPGYYLIGDDRFRWLIEHYPATMTDSL